MDIVGARWWKFDFHTHSPASFDYSPSDSSLKSSITPKEWLIGYIDNGIECVAITDHNTGMWVDRLKEAASELRKEGKIIYVFPGVEITANGNVHILAIFDPSKSTSDIHAVIGAVKFRGEAGSSDSVTEESAEKVIEEIIKSGGVAIPAHIDMTAGMCSQIFSSLTLKQICSKASAVEVVFPDAVEPEKSYFSLKAYRSLAISLPEVIGSDAHHPGTIGRAFTWVKMSSPTIDGLRLALLDGDSSVKRFNKVIEPNTTSETLLCSITIKSAQYCGRDKPLTINFNPWLNSIIGSRGSGKSSILEFIRLSTGRDKDILSLPESNEVRGSFARFAKIPLSRDADGVFHKDMSISSVIKKNGAYYNLFWSVQQPQIQISKYENDEWVQEQGDAATRFPIKIFSQKQIFDLAKNPKSLLALIDDSEEVDFKAWNSTWNDNVNLYVNLNNQRREIEGHLENKSSLLGSLSDVNQKIALIESSQHSLVLSTFETATKKRKALERFNIQLKKAFESVAPALSWVIPTLEVESFTVGGVDEPLIKASIALSGKLEDKKQKINNLVNEAFAEIESFDKYVNTSVSINSIIGAEDQYVSLVDQLAEKGIDKPGEYKDLIIRREEIVADLDKFSKMEEDLENLSFYIEMAYTVICEHRRDLTNRRLKFIAEHVSGNPSLQLNIDPFGDISNSEKTFRRSISKQDSTFISDIYDADKEQGILFELSKAISGIDFSVLNMDSLKSRLDVVNSFKEDVLALPKSKYSAYVGKRFVEYLEQLPTQNHDMIKAWFPDDKLTVRYHDGHRFKDISQGSAGQKAATILSFLLSYGSEPLVLDQPEDDLDNGLITSLIVTRLQQNKSRRQIIVVTHNPNIVVNGDSEYVIALQDKGQIQTSATGSLQELDVRKQVCEIMEGGEVALAQRYKRMVNI